MLLTSEKATPMQPVRNQLEKQNSQKTDSAMVVQPSGPSEGAKVSPNRLIETSKIREFD
jgi:hypothetical protein